MYPVEMSAVRFNSDTGTTFWRYVRNENAVELFKIWPFEVKDVELRYIRKDIKLSGSQRQVDLVQSKFNDIRHDFLSVPSEHKEFFLTDVVQRYISDCLLARGLKCYWNIKPTSFFIHVYMWGSYSQNLDRAKETIMRSFQRKDCWDMIKRVQKEEQQKSIIYQLESQFGAKIHISYKNYMAQCSILCLSDVYNQVMKAFEIQVQQYSSYEQDKTPAFSRFNQSADQAPTKYTKPYNKGYQHGVEMETERRDPEEYSILDTELTITVSSYPVPRHMVFIMPSEYTDAKMHMEIGEKKGYIEIYCPKQELREFGSWNSVFGSLCEHECPEVGIDLKNFNFLRDRTEKFVSEMVLSFAAFGKSKDIKSRRCPVSTIVIIAENKELYMQVNRWVGKTLAFLADKQQVPRHQGMVLRIIKGTIADQKADVLVNSTNEEFSFLGAVGSSLLSKAGPGIELEAKYKYKSKLKAGDVAETSGHNLLCSAVFHVVLDGWNTRSKEKQSHCFKQLQTVVTKCLWKMEDMGFTSIAFPALGTGLLKYPSAEAAAGMITAVETYRAVNPYTKITDVTIVVYTGDEKLFQTFQREHTKSQSNSTASSVHKGNPALDFRTASRKSRDDEWQTPPSSPVEYPSNKGTKPHSAGKAVTDDDNSFGKKRNEAWEMPPSNLGMHSREKGAIPKTKDVYNKTQNADNKATASKPSTVNERFRHRSEDQSENVNTGFDHQTEGQSGSKPVKSEDVKTSEILNKYLTNFEVVVSTNKAEKFKTWQETVKAKCGIELNVNMQKHQVSYKVPTWSQMGHVRRAMGLDYKETESAESDGEDSQGDDWSGEGSEGEVDNDSSDTKYNNNFSDDDEDTDDEKQFLASMKGNKQRVIKIKKVSKDIYETLRYFYQKDMIDMEQRKTKIKYINDTILLEGDHHSKLVTTEVKMSGFINDIKEFSFVEIPFETDGGKETKNKESIMKIVERLKKDPYWKDVLHIPYDDKVMLSGPIFERVSSFKEIVQQRSKGTQITSRTGRKLIAATEEATDVEDKNKETNSKQKSLPFGDKKTSFIKSLKIPKNSQTFKTEEGIDVHVYKEDILKLDVDAIVNAANKSLKHGGGIAKVISKAAGPQFKDESDFYIENYGELKVGQSCVTSAGRLPFKRIVHAVGPYINDYKQGDLAIAHRDLRYAVMTSLYMANKQGFTSVGIPSISSGEFGVPKKVCASAYCIAVMDFSRAYHGNLNLTEVHFVDINDKMVEINQLTFASMMKQDADAERKLSKINENNHLWSNISNRFKKKGKNKGKRKAVKKLSMMNGNVNIISGDIKTHLSKGCILACGLGANMESQAGSLVKELVKDDTKFANSLQREKNKNKKHECGDVISLPTEYFTCDTVYAVVLPTMTREKDKYRLEIQMCYQKLLQMAIKNKKSVTLKLLGTGKNMTLEESAEALQTVLCNVFLDEKRSNLKLCIVHNDAKEVERLKAVFSKEPEEKEFSAADKTRTRGEGSYSSANTNYSGDVDTSSDDESESASCQEEEVKTCAICLDDMEMPKRLDKCGHTFCVECIDLCFERKPVCPICSTSYGILIGNQPEGSMVVTEYTRSLQGYEGNGTIMIEYNLPNGIQEDIHPNPGHRYEGTRRLAYLPNTVEGRMVLEMLKIAFDRKLVFTIGRSVTSGKDNIVTWNDIHHKTNTTGGPDRFGYPDQDYLRRVQEELAAKGITKESIPTVGHEGHSTTV